MSHHVVPVSTYVKVFVTLIVLLILTVAVSYVDFGDVSEQMADGITAKTAVAVKVNGLNLLIALVIATAKAVVIVLFFMQLKYSSPLHRSFAISGVVFVAILFTITFADYVVRGEWDAFPMEAPAAVPVESEAD